MTRPQIGIGTIGFGWMGQAHSRGFRRIPSIFPERTADPVLVICADTIEARRIDAVEGFGYREATENWHDVVTHPDVDIVVVTSPNMLHVEMVEAAVANGKHVFCEKPVGGTPPQTVAAHKAAKSAGVVTGVGYNYRWAPLVQYTRDLIANGELGTITNYRGRFLSCYGNDPLGLLSWRFKVDQSGYGVSTDILSHSMDLAMFLVGGIAEVVGLGETFIKERPLPSATGTHYDRGNPGDPTGEVTNEDWFGAMVRFENGAVGTFETSRSMTGPESQNGFEVYGTKGSVTWNFEKLNELQVYIASDVKHTGYTTVFGGQRFPYHGNFVPGNANAIAFEDIVTIEDFEFLQAVAANRPFEPGFDDAVRYVSVQDALIKSWASRKWEPVIDLREA